MSTMKGGMSRRDFLRSAGVAAMGIGLGTSFAWKGARPAYAASVSPAMHVLNRLTWGARAEDVAFIEQMGIEGYIDWQLDYQNIPDPFIEAWLTPDNVLTKNHEGIAEALSRDYGEVVITGLWGRVARAALTTRQLYELAVEFWTDHLNVPIGDNVAERIIEDRDVIRRHALGNFRALIFASAQSPGMLYYLNNDSSDKEHPNENYARELMELHTLGVDGGYTERDVKEVARAFTGWTVRGNSFYFNPDMHDADPKTVLGRELPGGRGIEDGLDVLDLLASHPSTARYLAFKLCRRFVADTPPQGLVDRTAQVFSDTSGDIRATLRYILTSSEFMESAGQKLRRPLDYMVAVVRTTRVELKNPWAALEALTQMGQAPYQWGPPNGYPDVASAWMSTGGLLTRWNIALALALAAYGDDDEVEIDYSGVGLEATTAGELVDAAARHVLPGVVLDPADRDALIRLFADSADAPVDEFTRDDYVPGLIALVMASPYFQWR